MKPLKVNVSQEEISNLRSRILNTRWITETGTNAWDSNLTVQFLKELAQSWVQDFDWRKQEKYLNSFDQYKSVVDGVAIHFVLEKGSGANRTPLLLLHGWAGNFTDYLKVVRMLNKEYPDLDIIVPSIPGFGFSDTPSAMNSETVAALIQKLMTEVMGYSQYYVHGEDFGSFVAERLALDFPDSVKGLHLSDIPYYHLYGYNENPSQEETDFLEKINNWSMMDGAYAMIQATKPKTLATGLNDSPMGLAAWLLQLFNDFSDKEIPLFDRFDKDELLTNISLYWFSEKIYPSMRIYSEDANGFGEPAKDVVKVPTGFNFYRYDIAGIPPKEFAGRFFNNIIRWTEQDQGGHFGAMSNPETLKNDLSEFMKQIEAGIKMGHSVFASEM